MKVEISEAPFCGESFYAGLNDSAHGAQSIFLGVVRNLNHGRKVLQVHYDLWEPLARSTLRKIGQEAQHKWGGSLRIAIFHRRGLLGVGEVSVAIGVSSPHREEAYLASRFIIENIKHRAPIWKKEYYEDGETEWIQGHSLCGA